MLDNLPMELATIIEDMARSAYERGLQVGEQRVMKGLSAVAHLNGSANRILKALPADDIDTTLANDPKPGAPHDDEPADVHAAVIQAMIEHAEQSINNGEDPTDGVHALLDLLDDPDQLAEVLGTKNDAETVQKSLYWLVLKAWSEDLHPRDDNGRFVGKDKLQEAKSDPKVAAELRKRVTKPEQRAKLDKIISGEADPGRTKRGQAKHEAGQRRQAKRLASLEAKRLVGKVMDGAGTVEDVEAIAGHINSGLNRDQIGYLGVLAQQSKGGGRRRDEMVSALLDHVRGIVTPKEPVEPDTDTTGRRVEPDLGGDERADVVGTDVGEIPAGKPRSQEQGGSGMQRMKQQTLESAPSQSADSIMDQESVKEEPTASAESPGFQLGKKLNQHMTDTIAKLNAGDPDIGTGHKDLISEIAAKHGKQGLIDAALAYDETKPHEEERQRKMFGRMSQDQLAKHLHDSTQGRIDTMFRLAAGGEDIPLTHELLRRAAARQQQPTPTPAGVIDNATTAGTVKPDTSGQQLSGYNPGGTGAADGGGQPAQEVRAPRIITTRQGLTRTPDVSRVPEAFRPHLKPVQQEGVAHALDAMDRHGVFLLNDGTGTGKSRQQLAVAGKYLAEGKKVVIVAPAGVIKPDWKKGSLDPDNSFATGASAMGVPLHVTRAEDGLSSDKVNVTTYQNLGELKKHVDGNTVVIFDESHSMKNADTATTKHGADIMRAAHAVMHSTATIADKPEHVAYLMKSGALGMQKMDDVYHQLGMEKVPIYNKHLGREVEIWQSQVDPQETAARINGLFDKMTSEGLMVRRELAMDGMEVGTHNVDLTDEQHAEIDRAYKDALARTGSKGLALGQARLQAEQHKIPATVEYVKKELAAGRQPVVFMGLVNDNDEDERLATAPALKQALIDAGIPAEHIGEMHGAATKTAAQKAKAMKHFNEGKTPILLTTIQSGGTGVNLDDTTGDRPRSAVMMTPPLSANDAIQAAGRIHRLNTQSASKVHMMFSDSNIDKWNAGLLAKKMGNMGATVGEGAGRNLEAILPEEYRDAFPEEGQAHDPYEWQGKLATGRPVTVQTPYEHKDTVGKFGGRTVNVGSKESPQWRTKFPNKEAHQAYLDHVKQQAASEPVLPPHIKKKMTSRGERYHHEFSPTKAFWDNGHKKHGLESVGVSKGNDGRWSVNIWGKTPEETQQAIDKLKRMGAYPNAPTVQSAPTPALKPAPEPTTKPTPTLTPEHKSAIHSALKQLADSDIDRAREINGVGFNKMDSDFGAKLAMQGHLTDGQAAAAHKLLAKYRRQLGEDHPALKPIGAQ